MDFRVQRSNGIPEGSLLSVRAGHVRRQVPLEIGRPLKFPVESAACDEIQVDILALLGKARLAIVPATDRYDIHLDPGFGNSEMSCEVEVRRAASTPSAVKACAGATRAKESSSRRHEAALGAHKYMERHGLVPAVQQALHATVKNRPDEPLAYMANQLLKLASELKAMPPDGGISAKCTDDGSSNYIFPEPSSFQPGPLTSSIEHESEHSAARLGGSADFGSEPLGDGESSAPHAAPTAAHGRAVRPHVERAGMAEKVAGHDDNAPRGEHGGPAEHEAPAPPPLAPAAGPDARSESHGGWSREECAPAPAGPCAARSGLARVSRAPSTSSRPVTFSQAEHGTVVGDAESEVSAQAARAWADDYLGLALKEVGQYMEAHDLGASEAGAAKTVLSYSEPGGAQEELLKACLKAPGPANSEAAKTVLSQEGVLSACLKAPCRANSEAAKTVLSHCEPCGASGSLPTVWTPDEFFKAAAGELLVGCGSTEVGGGPSEAGYAPSSIAVSVHAVEEDDDEATRPAHQAVALESLRGMFGAEEFAALA